MCVERAERQRDGGREVKGHRGRDRGRYHETIEVSCLKFKETQLRPCDFQASLIGQLVKNLPAMQEMQEMWVRSLGREDPLEKEMATHSSIHAWRIPWTEEPGGLQFMGSQSQTRLND